MPGDGSNEYARRVATNARQRCVASIMGYAEKNLYPRLTHPQRQELRDKVLQSIGAYHDSVLDLLHASIDDGSLKVNQAAIEALARIHGLADTIEAKLHG